MYIYIYIYYEQKLVDQEEEKVKKLVRNHLIQEKDQEQQDSNHISLLLTYNQFLQSLTTFFRRNWIIFQTNKNLRELFQKQPMTAFKRNKS